VNTNNAYLNLSGITPEELNILQQTTVGLNEIQQKYFFDIYSGKRKNPEDVRIFCIASIIIPGLQRLFLEQIGWAVLYFFTGGLFFVMTIMDLINYKKLTLEFNQKAAYESFQITQMASNFSKSAKSQF